MLIAFHKKYEYAIDLFINMVLVCAECQCAPAECAKDVNNFTQCKNCTKRICCCIDIHQNLSDNNSDSDNHISIYSKFSLIIAFLGYVKGIYAAALCVCCCRNR